MKLLILLTFLAVIQSVLLSKPDESPGFFLKVTKNIPRLGRRSDPGLISVPPSKRFNYYGEDGFSPWFRNLIKPSNVMKRRLRPAASEAFEYNMVQPIDSMTLIELLRQDALPPQSVKFVHWKDFDLALQRDPELYSKVISLGRSPDVDLKENLRFNRFKGIGTDNIGMYQGVDNELYGDELIYEK